MRIYILIILISPFLLLSCSEDKIKPEVEIKLIMLKQQECWNLGDIDCFMDSYLKSDSLRFIGSKGINYGWNTTLDNYKKTYPDRATMGELKFSFEEVKVFTAVDAYVLGKWKLERNKMENIGGYFSLIWKKIEGKWVIISDHTS